MVWGLLKHQMEYTVDSLKMAKKKVKESLNGLMDHTTKEIFKMTKEMGKDILNQNKEVSKANGRTIKSKAPVI